MGQAGSTLLDQAKVQRERAEAARAHAEAARAQAESTATVERHRAEAARAHAEAAAVTARSLAAGLLCVGLCVDYVLHESRTLLRWRMRRRIARFVLPRGVSAVGPRQLFPRVQAPLIPRSLPTLLIGPTGCGKTTLLEQLARDSIAGAGGGQPAPTVVVRFRQPRGDAPGLTGNCTTPTAMADMSETAERVFHQIGFPRRRWVLGGLASAGFELASFGKVQAEFTPPARRLRLAFELLFDSLQAVSASRPPEAPTPLLLLDEAHGLITEDRLARAGGDYLFDFIGTRIVDLASQPAVRVVVAGSSAGFVSSFEARTPLGKNRVSVYALRDPEPDVVQAALVAGGRYTVEEAQEMIALCGCRLRLMEAALDPRHPPPSFQDFMAGARAAARRAFDDVFRVVRSDHEQVAQLARLLDAVELAEAGAAPRPSRMALPALFRDVAPSSVLFLDEEYTLAFQSRLHRRVWAESRSRWAQSLQA